MRLSLNITDYGFPDGPAGLAQGLADVIGAADEAGLDTVWVADHLLQAAPGQPVDAPMLEAYTTLGFLAGQSSRVRLGTMVSAATFRAPSLLLKAVTTLDVLSGGRAWLGLGAGYHEDEARALGLFLPPVPERFERLEEVLQIAHRLWSGDTSPFAGAHYRLEAPVASPRQLTAPHPPILIGGTGERRTLRLVARYADACNLFDIPDGGRTIRHKLEVLARHCAETGRPVEEIERTVSTRLAAGESADDLARRCRDLADLGIQHAVVITDAPWTPQAVATLGRARTLLAG